MAERLQLGAEPVGHRQPEVPDLGVLGQDHVTVAAAEAAAHGHHRQRIGGVHVRVRHAAAVEDQRVVEDRSVAIRHGLQVLQQARDHLQTEDVDLGVLRHLLRLVAVMRGHVPRLGDANRADVC